MNGYLTWKKSFPFIEKVTNMIHTTRSYFSSIELTQVRNGNGNKADWPR